MAGKTNRKYGRNKVCCARYTAEGRQEKNKQKKLTRHLAAHPSDTGQKTVPNYTRKKPLDAFERLLLRK